MDWRKCEASRRISEGPRYGAPFFQLREIDLAIESKYTEIHLSKAHSSFLLQEVLHTISAPSGQVQRIVIFKKNGVQAMVEYPLQCRCTLERSTVTPRHPRIAITQTNASRRVAINHREQYR
jgi:hypothetical protein